jgi:enoyl-CoA hydratase/carnithine racemase
VKLDESGAEALVDAWRGLYLLLLELAKPVVAAVNGLAVGAAFTAALLSDLRVGTPRTRFVYAEIDAGLPATVGPTLMTQFFGRGRMQEIWLTGRPVEAEEARAIGLLNDLVPEERLLPRALELAGVLASKPAVAMRLDRRWNRELLLPSLEENFAAARRYTAEAIASGEPQRVMAAFLERRRKP